MSAHLTQHVANALTANVAILDNDGVVTAVNSSWRTFANANGLGWEDYVLSRSYLAIANTAAGTINEDAQGAAAGIQELLSGQRERFSQRYPCHNSSEMRRLLIHAVQIESREGLEWLIHKRTSPRLCRMI